MLQQSETLNPLNSNKMGAKTTDVCTYIHCNSQTLKQMSQMQQQQKLYKHGHMTNGNTSHQTKLGSLWNECLRL